tara:strand:- start:584 stop:2236 length:1653 start_codon:yes stop_codon:yes gene_type:complete
MSITPGEISKTEAVVVLSPDGSIELIILPHSTQIGTKIEPQPLLVSGKLYAEQEVEILGTLTSHAAATFLSDLTVAGTLYAEKIIVEVDESVTGSLWVSGSLLVSQSASIRKGLEVNTAKGSVAGTDGDDFIVFGTAPGRQIISAHASTDQVLILSGGAASDPNEKEYVDMAFFVSGTVDSRGTTNKGTALFGGDMHISGNLTVDGNSPGGGSGSPGGSDTQVQYNNSTNFGGIAGATSDGTSITFNDSGILIGDKLIHDGDTDTYLRFAQPDTTNLTVGGKSLFDGSVTQMLILSGGGATSYDETLGADVAFYVSGSTDSLGTSARGAAIFGGDVAISGSLIAHGDNTNSPAGTISGSIHETSDGLSYLVAGSSVTIASASNGQVTISSTGAASDSFKTIAVSGQSDIVADSSTDTLTLVGGSNITITTDAANDTITFAAAGGGGGGSGDYQAKNANFTVGTSEYMFGIDSSQGHLTGTLPAAASAGSGKQYIFKDSAGYAGNTSKGIHISTDSNSEKIDSADAANILVNSGSITVMTDGSDWFVIGVS